MSASGLGPPARASSSKSVEPVRISYAPGLATSPRMVTFLGAIKNNPSENLGLRSSLPKSFCNSPCTWRTVRPAAGTSPSVGMKNLPSALTV